MEGKNSEQAKIEPQKSASDLKIESVEDLVPPEDKKPGPKDSKAAADPPAKQRAKKPVLDLKESKKKKIAFSLFGVPLSEKVFLARHLSTILKSGISLAESLEIIERQVKGKLKKVLGDVIAKVEAGKALNVALSDHPDVFDPLFINMVKVGEKSGTLDESLKYLSEQLSRDARLISKVKSASMYPIIVLCTAVLVGGGVSYFILPKLTKLFSAFGANLPLATRVLLAISNNLQHWGLYWLIGIIGAVILFVILLKIYYFRWLWQGLVLKIPIAGPLSKNLNLSRFSLTLGTLLKSSVAIDEALLITKDAISSIPYQRVIKKVLDNVNQGKSMAEGIDIADRKNRLFPGTIRAMIRVGERTGSLSASLLYIAEFYEEEVDNTTKDLATSLEPILLILIAIVVGFVAIAIVSPMYSILGSINK